MKTHAALERAAEKHWRLTRDSVSMYPTDDFTAGALWLSRRIKRNSRSKAEILQRFIARVLNEALNGKPAKKERRK